MFKTLKSFAVAAVLGMATVATSQAAPAFGPNAAVQSYAETGVTKVWHRDWHRPRPHQADRWTCSPREAARKASRMGLRNVRVARVTQRSIIVSGRRFGERHQVAFARFGRGCQVLGTR